MCPTKLTYHNSPHNRDILFYLLGHAQSSRWNEIGLAFPTDHNAALEAIHWARMVAKEDTQTIAILIINHANWTPQTIPLNKHPDIHIITTIPPHTIHYNPTPEWPKYYQYTEPSLTSIICIHYQVTPTLNPQATHELQKILE